MSRRPAPYSSFLLAATPLLVLLALALGSTALAGMALAWTAILFFSWGQARGRLRGIDARREVYPSAFEEDAVSVDILLDNRSGRAAHLLEVIDAFSAGISDRQALLEPGPLPAARRRRLRYRAFCSRGWGIHVVGPLSIAAWDAFGLFRAERAGSAFEAFAVFPRVHDVAALDTLGGRASLTPQEATAGRPGQGPVYLGVRDYRPGDPLRAIHWPATARRGSPVVKELEQDLVPYFTLFLDLHRAHRAGTGRKSTLEYLVRTAASLLWSAVCRGDVTQMFGEGAKPLFVPPGRGQLHLTHCLYELIRVRQEGGTQLLELVDRHRTHLPAGSTAAILSGTAALDCERLTEALEGLRAHAVRPLLLLVDQDSFVPIDRWPLPRERARERSHELASFLRAQAVPVAVLEAEQDLGAELGRPDLLEATA